jgi:aminopeptidase N
VSLAIGNYAQFQDYYVGEDQDTLLLDYYVYPSNLEEAQEIFREMHDYMDALTHYFGPYPFQEEKYGMAEFGWGGGMEHQTITSIGNVSPSWRYIYVHELAHQWFGDLITMDSWREIWLNEGFASYSEALYAEWAGFRGHPPGMDAYHEYMETQQYFQGGTIIREDTTSFGSLFNRIVYDKGSWILHMIRGIVGDEAFFQILRAYADDVRWRYGSATTEDFREICETISGRDFKAFFDQWLNYPYFPEYAYTWEIADRSAGLYGVEVTILQQQDGVIYEMPVDLEIQLENGKDTTVTVEHNRREQFYLIDLEEKPLNVRFDPENWILKQVAPFTDAQFTADVVIEEYYPNPFNDEVTITVRNWYLETITLDIFDVTGKKLRVLQPQNNSVNHTYEFKWDGRNDDGARVASGVYFVIPSGENTTPAHARKLIKLR